jgi:hypothetical protein
MLRKHLMAINRPKAPFHIRDGEAEGVDLVAEWKIVDARWYEIFAKAGIERVFKVLMKFDPLKGEVRAVDQEWSVEWRAGTPRLELAASAFREDGSFGKIYDYRFDTSEIKTPLVEAVHEAGWGWRSVAFGKL